MAHHTTHRRNLAAPDPKISMDPTNKKQPKSTPSTTKPHKHATDPDPTIASSTIHNISKHFSKLYTNHHKALASSKPSNPPSEPRIETHFQAKSMAISAIEDNSSKSIAKSNHPRRRTAAETEKDRLRAAITGVIENKSSPKESHEGCDIKRAFVSGKTDKVKKLSKKESHEGRDINRSSASLSRSFESGLREAREGNDMKRPSFSLAATGGGRRSFCNSQTELADFFSCTGVKVVSVDMPSFMQVHAVDCARKAYDSLEKFTSKTLALTLKKEFDGVYGPAWHCIVGTSFGSFVTHSVGGFLYFSMDHKLYILLFKTTVRRAD